jgi:GNAT superfamily N-acetyltransferase
MAYTIVALTDRYWPEYHDLFDTKGPAGHCFCMYWKIGPVYRKRDGKENEESFRQEVKAGRASGLLLLEGEKALGWCRVGPRTSMPWLDKTAFSKRFDDAETWAIPCFYVRIGYRRQGISKELIKGAIDYARQNGAKILEAFPLDGDKSASTSFTGYHTAFLALGFVEVKRNKPTIPYLRLNLV